MKSGDAAEEKPEWCYMEAMRFLSTHVSNRKTASYFQWDGEDQLSCSQVEVPPPKIDTDIELLQYDSSQDSNSRSSTKRQRSNESRERFDRLCGTIETVIATKRDKVSSRNKVFLELLDECLQKKPPEVQDRFKIELLNYVHNAN